MTRENQKTEIKNLIADAVGQAFNKSFKVFAVLFLIYEAIVLIGMYATGKFDRDETDGEKRSGFMLRTDYGSGCQYLENIKGGVTPRIAEDGITHMGCKTQFENISSAPEVVSE